MPWVARPPRLLQLPQLPPLQGSTGAGPGRTVCSVSMKERTSCSISLAIPAPPHLRASLGFIEFLCLTITSNFIAFTGRRVLFPAAEIFYVPWAFLPRPLASSFAAISHILPLTVEGGIGWP